MASGSASAALCAVGAGAAGVLFGYCLGARRAATAAAPTEKEEQRSEEGVNSSDASPGPSPQWSTSTYRYISSKRYRRRDAEVVDAAKRDVICIDAIEWLQSLKELPGHIVTGMPDIQEFHHLDDDGYSAWFMDAVNLMMQKLPEGGLACFHNTDARMDRLDTLSKVALIQRGVAQAGVRAHLLWHKIALAAPCGTEKKGRPGYTHMLCYIKGPPPPPASAYPQGMSPLRNVVFPDCVDRGQLIWSRGMGVIATLKTLEYIKALKGAGAVIVDPFCGYGTVPAVANSIGLRSVGIDKSPKCCKMARKLNTDDLIYNREALLADMYQDEGDARGEE